MFDRFKPRMIKFPENPQDSSSSKARRGARLWTPDRDEQKDAASFSLFRGGSGSAFPYS